jgi:hypothetical protein
MRLVGNPNLVGQRRAVAGMASFSGEGPFGAYCVDCVHVNGKSRRGGRNGPMGRCLKYSALMRGAVGPAFNLSEQACKYFGPAPKRRSVP